MAPFIQLQKLWLLITSHVALAVGAGATLILALQLPEIMCKIFLRAHSFHQILKEMFLLKLLRFALAYFEG